MFASPFDFVFNTYDQGNPTTEVLDIPYRGNERVFIKSHGKDKVAIIFAINFVDPDDVVLGKVFMTVSIFKNYFENKLTVITGI